MLASLLDSVRANGNRSVFIQTSASARGERFQPAHVPADEEVESSLLKYISAKDSGMVFALAVKRFNSNIDYSGLVHAVTADGWFKENKEKLILGALQSLLDNGQQKASDLSQ